MIENLKVKMVAFLMLFILPRQKQLVRRLVKNCSNLEMKPKEVRYLAPAPGMFGPVSLSGGSLPVFNYIVFDSALMDFVEVRVEVCLPDTIRYLPTLLVSDEEPPKQATAHDAVGLPMHHRRPVETPLKPEYTKPFRLMAYSLGIYFPLYRGTDSYGRAEQPAPERTQAAL